MSNHCLSAPTPAHGYCFWARHMPVFPSVVDSLQLKSTACLSPRYTLEVERSNVKGQRSSSRTRKCRNRFLAVTPTQVEKGENINKCYWIASDIKRSTSPRHSIRRTRGLPWRATTPWLTFLSSSLYVSKRGAYWDRLCCDVVSR